MERLQAIVLAAGRSSRMHAFKPLLEVEGSTLLERAIGSFTALGIGVVVVTGHRGDEVAAVAARAGARTVQNRGYERGMYSSVQAGAAALDPGVSGFFLLPADVPLVRPETVGRLARRGAAAWGAAGPGMAGVLYPAVGGEAGHPPLIAVSLRGEILAADPAGGLRELLLSHAAGSALVEVGDPGVVLDADTPDDLARIRERAAGEGLPSEARCLELLRERGAPHLLVAHSRAVAAVAAALAAALNERRQYLCEPLVVAAGLLHDVARDQPRHAEAGAELLERLGYARVAAVVRRHMGLDDEDDDVGEAQVVYLADKLVEGDRLVGLDERFAARLQRFARYPAALAGAEARKEEAADVLRRLERVLGRPVAGVLPPPR